jgi:signal transduction histidine kinase
MTTNDLKFGLDQGTTMTTKLKLVLITTLIALLSIAVIVLSTSTQNKHNSQTLEQLQLRQSLQLTNTVNLLFNQYQQSADSLYTTQQLAQVFESQNFDSFLDIANRIEQSPIEFALYDAHSNRVYRYNKNPESSNFYGLENVILNQIKNTGRQISIARVDDNYSLIIAFGLKQNGQLQGVGLSILPLDKRLLNYLKQSTGAEFQLKLNNSLIKTDEQINFTTAKSIAWPFKTNMQPQLSYIELSELYSFDHEIPLFSLIIVVLLMSGLISLLWVILSRQERILNQVSEALQQHSSPNQLISELNQIKASTETTELIQWIKDWIAKLSGQNKSLSNQLRVLESQINDIQSERDALQEERDSAVKAPKTKSEFLSRMGDEITTPMKTLSSMLHLLSEYNLQEEPRELLNIARRSANTLINNLNNILDFSKLDANLLKLQKSDFDVRQLFDEITSEYTPHAESKSLKLSAHVSSEVPNSIYNDPRRVRQIVKNLLGNAIRFTKEGEVKLTCDLVMQHSIQYLRITVSDTGVGIPKDAQKGLFDSLEQKTKLTNSSFAGRLRLIVSKKLAELMGGAIGVESEPQKGSTFWFTIAIN